MKNVDGETVAMKLVQNGKIPDECWNHDPFLENNKHETVAFMFAKGAHIPPI